MTLCIARGSLTSRFAAGWDRQPFLTTVRTGQPSLIPAINRIHHNFLFADYAGVKAIDHDDGSSEIRQHILLFAFHSHVIARYYYRLL